MLEKIYKILKDKTVGIAGIGGLGSNCAVSLARSGIGNIIIVDFDVVDKTNLNRQYFFYNQIGEKKVFALKKNIKKFNPEINVQALDVKLNKLNIVEIFKNCDIIVEAFDNAEMKQMLIETVLLAMPEKYIVSGSGIAGWGRNNIIKTIQYDNLFICGDGVSEVSESLPALCPRVAVVANMQANQVLEILLENLLHNEEK
ncbi:MAG: sulfur carrier protein ThiS adenylyltransferase ThiF [Bacteroidales bacterium]|nr:sulfur carrier protein ThiS adenylyltransferase ThiF [Bacteroidales bacterium]